MEYRIPTLANAAVATILLGLNALMFVIVPLVLVPSSAWWLLVLLPCALATNSMWFLAHEAFHANLMPGKRLNEILGRALCVCLFVPFVVVRFGHLQHHRFNGALVDRPDLYDANRTWPPLAWIGYYFQLMGGFYLQEALSFLVFLLPARLIPKAVRAGLSAHDEGSARIRDLAATTFAKPEIMRAARVDFVLALALHGLALWLYGPWWWAFALAVALRAFLVSFANNLPHYGTGTADVKYALNLRLPRVVNFLLLNFYCHRVHHHDPRIPWTRLPRVMREQGMEFDVGYMQAARAQFKGPIALNALNGR